LAGGIDPNRVRRIRIEGARVIKVERPGTGAATYGYARELTDLVSPRSARVIKRQLWELPFQSLHEALVTDSDEMLRANTSEDFEEGKRAFMEKRAPRFTGR